MNIQQLLPLIMGGGGQGDGMSLSGIQNMDPSGSTPQPAPLSGLPLAGDTSGLSGTDTALAGSKGAAGGLSGGQQGAPGLDFFQLMAPLQGGGQEGPSTPPNSPG